MKALSVKPIESVVAKSLSVKLAKPFFKSLNLALFIVTALSVAAEAAPAILSSSDKAAVRGELSPPRTYAPTGREADAPMQLVASARVFRRSGGVPDRTKC